MDPQSGTYDEGTSSGTRTTLQETPHHNKPSPLRLYIYADTDASKTRRGLHQERSEKVDRRCGTSNGSHASKAARTTTLAQPKRTHGRVCLIPAQSLCIRLLANTVVAKENAMHNKEMAQQRCGYSCFPAEAPSHLASTAGH